MLKLFVFSLFIVTVITSELKEHTVYLPVLPFNPDAVAVSRDGRISGGSSALDGEFPFANEMNLFISSNSYVLFSGSFLSLTWAITSLSPLRADEPEWYPLYIQYGSVSRTSANRKTVSVHSLSYWSNDNFRIDMAVLNHEPIVYSQYVGVIQLPPLSQENSNFNGAVATQTGHGGVQDLKYHLLTVNSNYNGCAASNPQGYERYSICAQSYTGSSFAQGGDSGAAYFVYQNNVPTLIGVHWYYESSSGNHYATRVSSFIREISQKVGLALRP